MQDYDLQKMIKIYFIVLNSCLKKRYCDGKIQCPFLTPNDEANCPGCASDQIRCDCNQEGNFTCTIDSTTGTTQTCYHKICKYRCDKVVCMIFQNRHKTAA